MLLPGNYVIPTPGSCVTCARYKFSPANSGFSCSQALTLFQFLKSVTSLHTSSPCSLLSISLPPTSALHLLPLQLYFISSVVASNHIHAHLHTDNRTRMPQLYSLLSHYFVPRSLGLGLLVRSGEDDNMTACHLSPIQCFHSCFYCQLCATLVFAVAHGSAYKFRLTASKSMKANIYSP